MYPNVSKVLNRWMQPITIIHVSKSIVDFDLQEDNTNQSMVKAVVQPLNTQELLLKPEGERAWKWIKIWIAQGNVLENDDKIQTKDSKLYRVMRKSDWSDGNYTKYECIEEYQGG